MNLRLCECVEMTRADVVVWTRGVTVKDKEIIDNGGKKLSPTVIGTYSFIQMDKNGNEINTGKLKDVWYG